MFIALSIVYVLVCLFLILVVLLQQGKGGGMGAAFGGGGSQTVFGGAGAGNFLTRLTAIAATLFMVLSALLSYMSSSGDRAMGAAEEVEAEQAADDDDEAGAAGTETETEVEVEAEPEGETSLPPSEDTPEEAAQDPVIDEI